MRDATEVDARAFEKRTGLHVFKIRTSSSLHLIWCYRIDNNDRDEWMLRVVPSE